MALCRSRRRSVPLHRGRLSLSAGWIKYFSGQKYPVLAQGQPESLLLYHISCICHDSFSYADRFCQCRHIPCTGLYHGTAVCLLAGLAAVAVCHSFCRHELVFIRLLPLCAKQVHHEMDTHHSCFLSGGGGLLFLTAGYGYYILHISGMGVTYGSLIGLIFLFLWIHLAIQIILAGGAVIMAWEDMRHRRL